MDWYGAGLIFDKKKPDIYYDGLPEECLYDFMCQFWHI